MTLDARRSPQPRGASDRSSRRRLALALLAGCVLSLWLGVCSASAVIVPVNGNEYGVQPETTEEPTRPTTPLAYEGGPVVHSTAPYALYWDEHGGLYNGSWEELISGFLENAGSASGSLSNDFAVITQYHDTSGANAAYSMTFRGAYTDTDAYPTSGNCSPAPCLTDSQIRAELTHYIAANDLPTGLNPSSGPTPIYYVFTPPGVTVCLEGSGENCSLHGTEHALCSYHSFIPAGGSLPATVLYVVEPWTAGNFGSSSKTLVSGTGCQDGTGTLQEPNQIGLGPEGEYTTGLADLIINNVTDEAVSTATDPLFNGWHDSGGKEVVDKCRNDYLGGELLEPPSSSVDPHTKAGFTHNQTISGRPYYLNDVFDQAAYYAPYPGVRCVDGVNILPQFTVQNPIRSGDTATFNATESDVTLGIQKYNWSFGDGTGTEVNCEQRVPTNGYGPNECTGSSGVGLTNPVASTLHAYTYGGTYAVTLTVTDYAGNTASVTHSVTVTGPPPPSPEHREEGSSGSHTTAGSSSGATPGTTATGTSVAPPTILATQSVPPQSLTTALSKGLAIRYSVSEQVAGRFEVLLASSTARRAGLRGPAATGLAKGTPPQTVIAKAILVTTKGGASTYRIKFSKATAARLRKLRRVTLMIRMLVHNAKSPTVTTVLNTVNLR